MLEPGPMVSDMYSPTPAQTLALWPQDRWEQTLHCCSLLLPAWTLARQFFPERTRLNI